MANLVDQINEMIDILQAIDPAAAAAFRGGSPNRLMNIVEPKKTIQNIAPNIASAAPPSQNAGRQSPGKISPAAEMRTRHSERNPLGIKLNTDNLIEGIIFSEILGKPVSRRRNHGRP